MNSKNENKRNIKINGNEVKTFLVPYDLVEIKDNLTFNINFLSGKSREKIINKAIKLHSQGNIVEAAKYYQYFIHQGFSDYRVFCNYGVILKDLSKLEEAELYTRKAIEIEPYSAEAYSNLGLILQDLDNLKEAELSTREAIKLKPDFAYAYSNLGLILSHLGNLKQAELSTREAIKLKPDFADAHNNLGTILRDLDKLKEAELSQLKAIKYQPYFPDAYSNLGNILKDLGKLDEAELMAQKAIKLKPNLSEAYFNLSHVQLLKGNYESGFINYDFRDLNKKLIVPNINSKITRIVEWKLQKDNKLLVISEQGLGDTIQYMRYIPYLKKLGLDISFCAQTKLHSLIKASSIDSHPLTPEQANQVSEGQWIPLLSLPRYLKVRPENPIIDQPYINSTNELNQKWNKILSKVKRPIVGINWQGNPKLETAYLGRSIPLEAFSTLANHNDLTFLSLQKGFGSEQLDLCSFKNKFIECQPQIDSTWDFLENTAIIENCDLIITCDTSIAHLAGGMGKEVWLLLRDIPFWTWGLKAESTFWYPSMRLFRQKERHNWNEVMMRVSSALTEKMETTE